MKVARGVDISDGNLGRRLSALDSGYLPRERWGRERRVLSGAGVIERSREQNVLAVFADAAVAEHLLRELA